MPSVTLWTNDPLELISERADRASAAFDERMQDLVRRVGRKDITPEEARAELQAISAARKIEIDKIYAGLK